MLRYQVRGAISRLPSSCLPNLPAGEELPLVVLCHGFTGNRQGDGHFAPLAEDLAAQWHCHCAA